MKGNKPVDCGENVRCFVFFFFYLSGRQLYHSLKPAVSLTTARELVRLARVDSGASPLLESRYVLRVLTAGPYHQNTAVERSESEILLRVLEAKERGREV